MAAQPSTDVLVENLNVKEPETHWFEQTRCRRVSPNLEPQVVSETAILTVECGENRPNRLNWRVKGWLNVSGETNESF